MSRLATSEISIFYLVSVAEQSAEQAGWNLTLSNDRFLVSRPIYMPSVDQAFLKILYLYLPLVCLIILTD